MHPQIESSEALLWTSKLKPLQCILYIVWSTLKPARSTSEPAVMWHALYTSIKGWISKLWRAGGSLSDDSLKITRHHQKMPIRNERFSMRASSHWKVKLERNENGSGIANISIDETTSIKTPLTRPSFSLHSRISLLNEDPFEKIPDYIRIAIGCSWKNTPRGRQLNRDWIKSKTMLQIGSAKCSLLLKRL